MLIYAFILADNCCGTPPVSPVCVKMHAVGLQLLQLQTGSGAYLEAPSLTPCNRTCSRCTFAANSCFLRATRLDICCAWRTYRHAGGL